MKRLSDFLISLIALILLFPIMMMIACAIRANGKGSFLFKQERPGKGERVFIMYKFRTMNEDKDNNGNLMPDKKRLTSIGDFLRKTSLDELPSLLNVLQGDMSLVGPRPLLIEYLPLYTEEQHRRHDLRPGITGWAQINGRNLLTWGEKFELDVWYVDNQSFGLDLKIIFITVGKVLRREGISSKTSITMEKYEGRRSK
jgi:lipopolysaccharide/colanic/teichoic acid biosynthesis glycosyltransferase